MTGRARSSVATETVSRSLLAFLDRCAFLQNQPLNQPLLALVTSVW
jgi:hypothetical protein